MVMADSRFAVTTGVSLRAEEDVEGDMTSLSFCGDDLKCTVLRDMCRMN